MGGNEFDTIFEKEKKPFTREKIGKFGFIDPLARDLQFMFCDENPMPIRLPDSNCVPRQA